MAANWQNKTVWTGDNLPIMRGMNSDSVDLIYLDPPFNSNANYAAPIGSIAAGAEFKDTWTLNDLDIAWLDLIESKYPALNRIIQAAVTDSNKSYLVYMAVRLLEMKRVLNDTGSIYLHCDPTMSHGLKLLMDGVFAPSNFRNEIVWKRTSGHSDSKTMGSVHDVILYYSKSDTFTHNIQYMPYSEEYIQRRHKHQDPDGRRFMDGDLTAKGLQSGGYLYEYRGITAEWRVPLERMKQLDDEDRLYFTSRGGIRFKRYLDEMKGVPVNDIWIDISPVNSRARERTGYPTQKPIALLERIISTSSNENDIVFDPFCGCATTMVAADRLQRQWVGIDLSQKAVELVEERIRQDQGGVGNQRGVFEKIIARNDIPQRTDIEVLKLYNSLDNKKHLYGQQEGHCNGCSTHFEMRNLEVDHIIAKSHGGTDHIKNLQLLCGNCNRVKGNRGQEYLIAKLEGKQVSYA